MMNSFKERGDDLTIILQAVGASACAQALKAVARLQQMVASQKTADCCVVFKISRFRSGLQRNGEEQAVDPATGEGMYMGGYQLIVNLGNRSDWPAAAFEANSAKDASEAASADSTDSSSDRSDSARQPRRRSRSSSSSSDGSGPINPTAVKASVKDESQRLTKHALRSSELKLPAQFVVAGGKQNLDVSALKLCSALGEARRQSYYLDEPADMLCTITSVPYTVQFSPRSNDSKGIQQPEDTAAAAAADAADADAADAAAKPAAAAAAGSDAAAAAAAAGPVTLQRVRYVVTVQRCHPGPKALAAAKRRKQQASGEAANGVLAARGRSKVRPGYIEVKEEEWNQLKEQLAVVPHLTEQLQIMTRQHEQLLSLLAAQQGQQQEAA
jgi:hypothetical protein